MGWEEEPVKEAAATTAMEACRGRVAQSDEQIEGTGKKGGLRDMAGCTSLAAAFTPAAIFILRTRQQAHRREVQVSFSLR